MNDKEKTSHISVSLDAEESKLLAASKEKSGIKGSSDLVRYLIAQYAKDEK